MNSTISEPRDVSPSDTAWLRMLADLPPGTTRTTTDLLLDTAFVLSPPVDVRGPVAARWVRIWFHIDTATWRTVEQWLSAEQRATVKAVLAAGTVQVGVCPECVGAGLDVRWPEDPCPHCQVEEVA